LREELLSLTVAKHAMIAMTNKTPPNETPNIRTAVDTRNVHIPIPMIAKPTIYNNRTHQFRQQIMSNSECEFQATSAFLCSNLCIPTVI